MRLQNSYSVELLLTAKILLPTVNTYRRAVSCLIDCYYLERNNLKIIPTGGKQLLKC